MEVNIVQGNNANILFEVHSGWFYHEDVHMRAESVPSGISLNFEPEVLKRGDKSVSQVNVSVDKNTSTGEHVISIIGDGPDGKEHDCKLKLKVHPSYVITPTPKSTETTPTPTPTTTNPIPTTLKPTIGSYILYSIPVRNLYYCWMNFKT
jgi:hypothetical protein